MPTYTLTNNTDHIVYPFLFATNDAEKCSTQDKAGNYACSNYDPNNPAKNPGCNYDPIDPYDNDYRGYIGYQGQDGKNYPGLPAGQQVSIPVPPAFWDAGRIFIASDSADLTPNATAILTKGNIQHPMQPILNRPVRPNRCIHHLVILPQTAQVVAPLDADFTVHTLLTLHHCHRLQAFLMLLLHQVV